MGVFVRIMEGLASEAAVPKTVMIAEAYLKAHRRALAETINGLYKTEVIRRRSSWKTMVEAELETPKWVDWFNNRRLLAPIRNIPPAEAKEAFYANLNTLDRVAYHGLIGLRRNRGGSLKDKGIKPCSPGLTSRGKRIKHGKRRYKRRNRTEIMFGRLKDWRRVPTRYDRSPKVFLSAVALAATVMFWL